MISAIRIVKTKYVAGAFNGEGARLNGGRWNSPGTAMVDTSQNGSLAQLELLVHIDKGMLLNSYSLIQADFEETLVETLEVSSLPSNWDEYPAPIALQKIGDDWCSQLRSVVLLVPSTITKTEANYLINPNHPKFGEITIGSASPIQLDPRLK